MPKIVEEKCSSSPSSYEDMFAKIKYLEALVIEKKFLSNGEGESKVKTGSSSLSVERNTVRLDGIEVYAVVSALTVASSIACLDVLKDTTGASVIAVGTFSIANMISIFTGLHATLVFSLITMYGRTAVGLDRDELFLQFFHNTGNQRKRGFNSFLYSLYSFMIQVIIMAIQSLICSEGYLRYPAYFICCSAMAWIVAETRSIIDMASVIFLVPTQSAVTRRTSSAYDHGMIVSPLQSVRDIPSSDACLRKNKK